MERRRRRIFPEAFKREAVDRVASSGLSPGRVAAELGLHETVLRRWMRWLRPAGQESIGLMRESPVEDAWLRRQTVTVQTYLFPIPI